MKVIEILNKAKENNIAVFVEEGKLFVKVSKQTEPDKALLADIKEYKAEILSFLLNEKIALGDESVNIIQRSNLSNQQIPLSFAQERLWFIDKLQGSTNYHISMVLRIEGNLDIQKLEASFRECMERHEILRTIYYEENDSVFQESISADNWKLNLLIWDEKALEHEINQPFDLSKDYMLRATLLKKQENLFILSMVVHHIAADGWSMPILISELTKIYGSKVQNSEVQLPDLPIQYSDYAIWQKGYLKEEVLEGKLNYWENKLKDLKPLDLPVDFARPSIMTTNGATKTYSLGKDLRDKLLQLTFEEDTTLFMTLLSSFSILLSKFASQKDVCIGIPIANRTEQQTASLIGFFVNSLAIRTNLEVAENFVEYLRQVKETAIEAYANQDVPFEKIIDRIETNRDLSRSPIFQTLFTYDATENSDEIVIEDIQLYQEPIEDFSTKYELIFNATESSNGLLIAIQYCTDLYEETTIDRFVDSFEVILHQIVADKRIELSRIEIISEKEKAFLYQKIHTPTLQQHDAKTFVQLFEELVERVPNNLAVAYEGKELSYAELNKKANQLAHYLIETYNIDKGDIIGVLTNRSEWYLIALLGILKTGACYLPIDVEYPSDRKRHILNDAQVKALLIESEIFSEVIEFGIKSFSLDIMFNTLKTSAENIKPYKANSEDLAYVIYTSGSTGLPKGVKIQHKSLLNLCNWHNSAFEVTGNSRGALFAGIAFDASVWEIFPYLLKGAAIFPINDNNIRYDVQKLHKFIVENRISHIYLPTQICLEFVLGELELTATQILTGGEALKLPKTTTLNICNNYGPTENTVVTTFFHVGPQDSGIIPIGNPISNVSILVLDEHLNLLPRGVFGTLYIGGASLAKGYLNKPELTQERFIENPYNGERMYNTGDLARWNNKGILEFKERSDDQIKIRGFRVELGEIEIVINNYEGVKKCVVLLHEDNQENKQLIAFISGKKSSDFKALKNYLHEKLPNYMIPSLLIEVEDIPINVNGKVDRASLKTIASEYKKINSTYTGPRNKSEKSLVEIWKQVLAIDQIGIEDDFFELGGHSLLATKVISKIKNEFDVSIAVRDIFNYPTISELSYMIENKDKIDQQLNMDIDLVKESEMDVDFGDLSSLPNYKDDPENVLLTGVTGFIGAYILHELLVKTHAKIHCLMRADNLEMAKKRIIDSLTYYSLYQEEFMDRLEPVLGDLGKPMFGIDTELYNALVEKVDYIFHSATFMDHFSSYDKLKQVNVTGNVEMIRFAIKSKIKKVIYVSTLPRYSGNNTIKEDDSRDAESHLYSSGYVGSKWVGEKIMSKAMQAGLDVQIHRVGLVTGDLHTGRMPKEQWFPKALKSCYEIGLYTPEFLVPIIPVDFVSKAIVGLGLNKNQRQGYFHLANRNLVSLKNMFEENNTTGKEIRSVTMQEILIAVLENSDKLYLPIIPFIGYGDPEITNAMEGNHPVLEDNSPTIHANEQTLLILKKELGLEFPDVKKYFKKYLINAINEYKN